MTGNQADHPNGLNREISSGMVRLYKDYLGRGPRRIRTTIADDLVVCTVEDSLTKAELKLTEAERAELVRQFRRAFQGAMSKDCMAMVEGLTDRKVRAFLSDHDPRNDVAVEVFVMESAAPDVESG